MAETTPTVSQRSTSGHGGMRKETGVFTTAATGEVSVKTKLNRIVFASITGVDDPDIGADNLWYWNARTNSTAAPNGGWFHLYSGWESGKIHSYKVYGY